MNKNEIASFAETIALNAGKIISKGFRSKSISISYKSRTNIVTNIDKESEKYLFNSIKDQYPDHTVIAEEGSRREREGEFIWYVDPLDATNNYAHGIPYFCISIGIYSIVEQRSIIGIVYDPFHKEMFKGIYGQGAFLNGDIIEVSRIDDIGISILATGFPYDKTDPKSNNLDEFNAILPCVQGARRMGSAALDLSYVACGRFDGYWEPGLFPWDMAAGSIIVEEAGGKVTKYNGDPFDPECPEIAASNSRIHKELLTCLCRS
ncbi:MAG: inositol monophosphatase family protein [Spirochaetota bacterium]|nr:inositol monophosphatase family protein [Spirochaetota bacterium]